MEQTTQPSGMMGQLPSASPQTPNTDDRTGYTGEIVIDGEPVTVKGGIGKYEDSVFYVSDDGSIVIDDEYNVVGRIQDGTFVPTDEDHINQLREMGVLE